MRLYFISLVLLIVLLSTSRISADGDSAVNADEYYIDRIARKPDSNWAKADFNTKQRTDGKFSWEPCDDRKEYVFDVQHLVLEPDPIEIPGSLNLSLRMVVKEEIDSPLASNVSVSIEIQGIWVNVCSYLKDFCEIPDLCALLARMQFCPPPLVEQGFKCKCPIKPGTFEMKNLIRTFKDPVIPTSGYFKLNWRLESKGREIGCYNCHFYIKALNLYTYM